MLYNNNLSSFCSPVSDRYLNAHAYYIKFDPIYIGVTVGNMTRSGLNASAANAICSCRPYVQINWWWGFFMSYHLNSGGFVFRYIFRILNPNFNSNLMSINNKAGSNGNKYSYYNVYSVGFRSLRIISCWIDFFLNYYYHSYFNFSCLHVILGLRYNFPDHIIYSILYDSANSIFSSTYKNYCSSWRRSRSGYWNFYKQNLNWRGKLSPESLNI